MSIFTRNGLRAIFTQNGLLILFTRNGLLAIIFFCLACNGKRQQRYAGWEVSGGTREGIRYSSLTQIDTSNVKDLKLAWVYHSGDADTVNHSQIQCNPIMVDDVLYGTSPQMKLFALDASTGKQKWVFNPFDSLTADKKCSLF